MFSNLKESISSWMEKGSTINNQGCPLCGGDDKAHRMDRDTRDIWCTQCGSEWEFTGEKVDSWREYELTACPEDEKRVGNKRSGFEWSQMTNDMGTEGVYESTPRFEVSEDANPAKTFFLGMSLTGFSFPVMATGFLLPLGAVMLLGGIVLMPFGVFQWWYKPRDQQ